MRLHRIALLTLCLLTAATARAQPVPGTVAGEQLVIGATTVGDLNTTAVAKIMGVGARTPGQDLAGFNSSHELVRGILGTADIPSVFTRRDVAETVPSIWNFSGGLMVGGNLTGASGTLQIASPTRISGATAEWLLHESDAGGDEKYWRFKADNDTFTFQLVSDALGTTTDVFNLTRTAMLPGDLRWGQNVTVIRPQNTGVTHLGTEAAKYSTLNVLELIVGTLVAEETIARTGGHQLVVEGSELMADVDTTQTCVGVKHNSFRAGDTVLLQARGKYEKMVFGTNYIDCRVSGNCASVADLYAYCSITRAADGTPANEWFTGDAVISEGGVGDGWLELEATRSSQAAGYVGQVVSDGPVAYWRMSESPSGQTVDVMGNVPNAIEAGTPSTGLGTLSGAIGTLTADPVFDNRGATGYLTVANAAALQITNDLTIEFWMYRQSATPATSDIISRGGTKEYSITVDTNGAMIFCHGNVSTFECETTANGFVPTGGADYTHYTVVRDAASSPKRVLFYKDGVLAETHTYTQIVTNSVTTTLHIGHNPDVAGRFVDGDIDEVAIYNYQVSADRLLIHYNSRKNNSISRWTRGPSITGWVRTGTGAFDVAQRWRCGNGAGSDYVPNSTVAIFGCWFGNAATTSVGIDATNGFVVKNAGVTKLQFDISGNGFLAGSLAVTNNITVGQSGAIMSGATAYDTGEGYWLSCNFTSGSCDPLFRIGTTSAGTSYFRWTGSAVDMKSNTLAIDSNGIIMASNTAASYASPYGYRFGTAVANSVFGLHPYDVAGGRSAFLVNTATSPGKPLSAGIAVGTSGGNGTVRAFDDGAGGQGVELSSPNATLTLTDQTLSINGLTTFSINSSAGFSGTKVMGSCTVTFVLGTTTNVTGC